MSGIALECTDGFHIAYYGVQCCHVQNVNIVILIVTS